MWKYNNMPYDEMIKKQYSYFDNIDFMPYIEKYEDLHELVWAVEDDYDDTELTNNDFLQGCIFNSCDEYELSVYLMKKYNIDYREEITTRYVRGNLECGTK